MSPAPPVVTSTYRLQLHAGFTTADAAGVVPRLARLGVSHLYLSPVLTSMPGSTHGYDVVDHTAIDPEIGGREGLVELAAVAREHGLGVVVDVVPNHMALPEESWRNARVWEYLREGPEGPSGAWFDVDLAHLDGRIGLPVLGEPPEAVAAAGDLVLTTGRDDEGPAAGQPVLRYFDRVLPLRPDSPTDGAVLDVLAAQHYRLASWRDGAQVLNYRRFFEVDELIAVRVEDPEVFDATHRLLLDLHHDGVIDGFRIDHPDGLADPGGYLTRLSGACRPGTPIWVEKILIDDERLPGDWPCAGTTGYDGLLAISSALTPRDPDSVRAVDDAWERVGGEPDIAPVVAASQELAVDALLRPEVARLVRLVTGATGVEPDAAHEAVRERLLGTRVYREYGDAVDLGAIGRLPGADRLPAEVATRLQQTSGPVMAKGVEDTAFYRWHRLSALNEVGGEPQDGREPGPGRLHAWAAHQQQYWPGGLVTLTTHDTKRSADVRARVLAVAADAEAWAELSERAAELARDHDVDEPTAHLAWQSVLGLGNEVIDPEPERLAQFLIKAAREAKEHTAWVDGDESYEQRVLALAATLARDGEFDRLLAEALSQAKARLHAQVLGAAALHLMLPGVPDVYQGTEGVRLLLVDPDNRRPVDHEALERELSAVEALVAKGRRLPQSLQGRKLLLTTRLLRLRREHPELVGADAGYDPLELGDAAVGFVRGGVLAVVVRLVPGGDGADSPTPDAVAHLPAGRWRDVVCGTVVDVADAGTGVGLASLTPELPVAILHRTGAASPEDGSRVGGATTMQAGS